MPAKNKQSNNDSPSFDEFALNCGDELSKLMEDYNKNIVPFTIKATLQQIEHASGRALGQKYRDDLTRRTLKAARTKSVDEVIQGLMKEALKFETDENLKLMMDPSVPQSLKMAALANKVKENDDKPLKMEASFQVDETAKNKSVATAINLLLKLVGSNPAQPFERLNDFMKSLKMEKVEANIDLKKGLLKWQQKVISCDNADAKNHFDCLVRFIDAAIEYRRQFGSNMEEAEKFQDANVVIATGTDILQMAFAISPRGLFGVVALDLMGMTVSSIQKMSQDEKVAFITILSASLGDGAINRLVPTQMVDVVDMVVEGLIPALELSFCEKLQSQDNLNGGILASRFVSSKTGVNFGIKLIGSQTGQTEVVYMPDDRIIHGSLPLAWSPKIISLMDGKVRLNAYGHRKGTSRTPKESAAKMAAYLKHFGLPPTSPS